MADGTQKLADWMLPYAASGVVALGIVVLANKAAWMLYVLIPAGLFGTYVVVKQPRGLLPASERPIRTVRKAKRPSKGGRGDRRHGWNSLGALVVRSDDPYIVLKGETPVDGVAVPVPPGKWFVHARAELVDHGLAHMRDTEVRIVQDPHWVSEEWGWTRSWEPMLSAAQGSASQGGRIAVADGLIQVHTGRRVRPSKAIVLQPGFSDGAFGVNVIRDLSGQVVVIVSRFG
ncbi:MAG TPA: hypothetical protein VLJ59_18880 [Mycobacteriales bacterium]|nr:hypothetical protein [Mycobacteriales bacterium]